MKPHLSYISCIPVPIMIDSQYNESCLVVRVPHGLEALSNGLVRQSLSRFRAGMTYFKKNEDEYELITSAYECLTSAS